MGPGSRGKGRKNTKGKEKDQTDNMNNSKTQNFPGKRVRKKKEKKGKKELLAQRAFPLCSQENLWRGGNQGNQEQLNKQIKKASRQGGAMLNPFRSIGGDNQKKKPKRSFKKTSERKKKKERGKATPNLKWGNEAKLKQKKTEMSSQAGSSLQRGIHSKNECQYLK